MQILLLQDLPGELFSKFTDDSNGPSVFSQLRSSQTGNERTVTKERLNAIISSPAHIMLVATEEERLVGMVVGQLITGIGNEYFYVHDIVIDETTRGSGLGTTLMNELMQKALALWPTISRFQLTSRPSRGTGPFFQKLGFHARTKENNDETIVYVKDIEGYSS